MVTPEILEYVRTEISKGKTREEIYKSLISSGKWSEADLSAAFRTVIPMQGIVLPNLVFQKKQDEIVPALGPDISTLEKPIISTTETPTPTPTQKLKLKLNWQILILIIIGLFCVFSLYFYRPQIINFWNSSVKSSQELSTNSWNSLVNSFKNIHIPSFKMPAFDFGKIFNTNKAPLDNNAVVQTPVMQPVAKVKDCGIGVAPKLDDPTTYKNNPVLSCLGASAVNCENAKGILKDDFFPNVFEIIKLQNACDFKLSYGEDSTLVDITGKKLALQYISCPLDIVKEIDNTKPTTPQFSVSDKTDLSKYAIQIYFYGTLGLFVENNLDPNKIQTLGCKGEYIQSVIKSYNSAQKK